MDDRQLLKELEKDNDVAFGVLIKKYEKLVFNTSYKIVQNTPDAEDVCQEVFLSVFRCLHQLRNEEDLSGWLFRIAYNKSLSFLRKNNPARANATDVTDYESPKKNINYSLIDHQTPMHFLEEKEASEELFKAIDKLPGLQKQVLLMHKFEDLSHKEICENLNLTKSSVESLIFRAKSNLRKSLITYFNDNYNKTS